MEAPQKTGYFSKRTVSALQPNPEHFFSAKSHEPVWRVLRTAVVRGEGTMIFTGEAGTGKSLLLMRLQGILPENRDMALISNPVMDPESFLRVLLKTVDAKAVPAAGADGPVTSKDLLDALEKRGHEGRKILIAVDQAHLLSPENVSSLSLMIPFSVNGLKPVQVLLAGRPELSEQLITPPFQQIRESLVGSGEITPLTRAEVWEYLHFQLSLLLGGTVRVSWPAWLEIYGLTQGNPLEINRILELIYPELRAHNIRTLNRGLVRRTLGTGGRFDIRRLLTRLPLPWAAGLGGVLILGFLFGGSFSSAPEEPTGQPLIKVSKEALPKNGSAYVPLRALPPVTADAGRSGMEEGGARDERIRDSLATRRTYAQRLAGRSTISGKSASSRPAAGGYKKRTAQSSRRTVRVKPPVHPPVRVARTPKAVPVPPVTAPQSKTVPATIKYPEVTAKPKARRPLPPQSRVWKPRPLNSKPPSRSGDRPVSYVKPPVFGKTPAIPARKAVEKKAAPEIPVRVARKTPDRTERKPDETGPAPVAPPPLQAVDPITSAAIMSSAAIERIAKPGLYPNGKTASGGTKQAVLPPEIPSPSNLATEETLKSAGQLYVVQIGSFLNRENADRLKNDLEKKGLDPYVHLYEKNHNRWFSVRMNYRSRQSAERMAQVVREEIGIPTRVIDLFYE